MVKGNVPDLPGTFTIFDSFNFALLYCAEFKAVIFELVNLKKAVGSKSHFITQPPSILTLNRPGPCSTSSVWRGEL